MPESVSVHMCIDTGMAAFALPIILTSCWHAQNVGLVLFVVSNSGHNFLPPRHVASTWHNVAP